MGNKGVLLMTDQNWPNLAAMFYDQVNTYGDRPFLWAKRDGEFKPLSWATSLRE